jgi:glycosyltransferase involved in cell wall biosynthesis
VKVLHCIYDDPSNPWVAGGGALRVLEIYRRLADRVDVTVVSGNHPGALDGVRSGVRYRRVGASRPYALSRASYAAAATRLLWRGGYDAGVVDFSGYTPIVVPRGRPVGVVVHMLHGPTAAQRWGRAGGALVRGLERRLLRRAGVVCTTSEWMRREVGDLVPDARLVLARSGVEDVFFRAGRSEEGYALFYGRFDVFHKGIDTVLAAFEQLAAGRPGLTLRLAGRGKDEGRVREMVRRSRFAGRITLHPDPPVEEVIGLFSGALVFLMPSRLEGLPMAPVEAMAAGVPVVASRVGALDEVVLPPAGGVLVPPDDPGALADAAAPFLDDPDLRERTSRSAREAAARFTWDRVVDDHLAFLHLVASSGRA